MSNNIFSESQISQIKRIAREVRSTEISSSQSKNIVTVVDNRPMDRFKPASIVEVKELVLENVLSHSPDFNFSTKANIDIPFVRDIYSKKSFGSIIPFCINRTTSRSSSRFGAENDYLLKDGFITNLQLYTEVARDLAYYIGGGGVNNDFTLILFADGYNK